MNEFAKVACGGSYIFPLRDCQLLLPQPDFVLANSLANLWANLPTFPAMEHLQSGDVKEMSDSNKQWYWGFIPWLVRSSDQYLERSPSYQQEKQLHHLGIYSKATITHFSIGIAHRTFVSCLARCGLAKSQTNWKICIEIWKCSCQIIFSYQVKTRYSNQNCGLSRT